MKSYQNVYETRKNRHASNYLPLTFTVTGILPRSRLQKLLVYICVLSGPIWITGILTEWKVHIRITQWINGRWVPDTHVTSDDNSKSGQLQLGETSFEIPVRNMLLTSWKLLFLSKIGSQSLKRFCWQIYMYNFSIQFYSIVQIVKMFPMFRLSPASFLRGDFAN